MSAGGRDQSIEHLLLVLRWCAAPTLLSSPPNSFSACQSPRPIVLLMASRNAVPAVSISVSSVGRVLCLTAVGEELSSALACFSFARRGISSTMLFGLNCGTLNCLDFFSFSPGCSINSDSIDSPSLNDALL